MTSPSLCRNTKLPSSHRNQRRRNRQLTLDPGANRRSKRAATAHLNKGKVEVGGVDDVAVVASAMGATVLSSANRAFPKLLLDLSANRYARVMGRLPDMSRSFCRASRSRSIRAEHNRCR